MDTIIRKRRRKKISSSNLWILPFTMDHSRLVQLFFFIALLFIAISGCRGQKTNQQYFRLKPQDVNATEKETIILLCEVGNLGGLVQWSKDGFLLGMCF